MLASPLQQKMFVSQSIHHRGLPDVLGRLCGRVPPLDEGTRHQLFRLSYTPDDSGMSGNRHENGCSVYPSSCSPFPCVALLHLPIRFLVRDPLQARATPHCCTLIDVYRAVCLVMLAWCGHGVVPFVIKVKSSSPTLLFLFAGRYG